MSDGIVYAGPDWRRPTEADADELGYVEVWIPEVQSWGAWQLESVRKSPSTTWRSHFKASRGERRELRLKRNPDGSWREWDHYNDDCMDKGESMYVREVFPTDPTPEAIAKAKKVLTEASFLSNPAAYIDANERALNLLEGFEE